MCYTLFQFFYLLRIHIQPSYYYLIIVLMFLFFTFKMVDSNVIIWSLLAFGITKSLYILFVLCHCVCFMFFVVVIRFAHAKHHCYIVVVTVGSLQINLKLSLYFLSHFGQLELLDDFLDLVA
jgi:hypothetical protein